MYQFAFWSSPHRYMCHDANLHWRGIIYHNNRKSYQANCKEPGGGGGGYSLYEGYYICSSVLTPLFQVSGKFVEFRPLYFSKNEENVVFWPLYFSKNEENVVFRPLFFTKNWAKCRVSTPLFDPCSVSRRRAVRSIPIRNLTEYPPRGKEVPRNSLYECIGSHRIISEGVEIIVWRNWNNLNFHTLFIGNCRDRVDTMDALPHITSVC